MKKRSRFRLAVILLILLAIGMSGACLLQKQHKTDVSERVRITAILPHNDYGYWTVVRDGIVEGGLEYDVDVKIVLPRMNYDVPQMTELIRQEIAAKADAIIVQGIDNEDYLEALQKAESQGILIALIDTDVGDRFSHLYVGTDNYAAGIRIGEAVVQATGGRGTIAILSGAENYPNLEERCAGIREAIKEYPELTIACTEYNQYDSLRVIEKYYTIAREYPKADTLVCIEGTGGLTLGPRLSKETPLFEHIVVFDMTEESAQGLCSGAFDGIMTQQQKEMGRIAVREIHDYLENGGEWNRKILTDTEWITVEDLEEQPDE